VVNTADARGDAARRAHGRSARRTSTGVGRFVANRRGIFGAALVLVTFAVATLAPFVAAHDPNALAGQAFHAPGLTYPLGTDSLGRDVLSRVIWGTRIALTFGTGAALMSMAIGCVVGLLGGFFGGWLDHVLSRLVELFLILPRLFLILLVSAVFGSSVTVGMLIVGLTIWPSNARLVRSEVLRLKHQPYVEAATALGATPWRIMWRHVLPNSINTVIANTTLNAAAAILIEASLGYLGLGDANHPSWGQMLQEAQPYLARQWWLAVSPGVAISLIVVGFTFLGDGIGEALDPRLSKGR